MLFHALGFTTNYEGTWLGWTGDQPIIISEECADDMGISWAVFTGQPLACGLCSQPTYYFAGSNCSALAGPLPSRKADAHGCSACLRP